MTQSALPRIAPADMPQDIRAAWEQLNALTGDASFVEVFANAPQLLQFVMHEFYAKIFFGGRVEQRYKQLMRLKLSLLHGCRTCNKQNIPGAKEAGLSDAEIDALAKGEHGGFDDPDCAVIEYAQLVSIDNQTRQMPTELQARLAQHFDVAQICELGVVGAFIAGMAKLSFVLDLVEKESYCQFA